MQKDSQVLGNYQMYNFQFDLGCFIDENGVLHSKDDEKISLQALQRPKSRYREKRSRTSNSVMNPMGNQQQVLDETIFDNFQQKMRIIYPQNGFKQDEEVPTQFIKKSLQNIFEDQEVYTKNSSKPLPTSRQQMRQGKRSKKLNIDQFQTQINEDNFLDSKTIFQFNNRHSDDSEDSSIKKNNYMSTTENGFYQQGVKNQMKKEDYFISKNNNNTILLADTTFGGEQSFFNFKDYYQPIQQKKQPKIYNNYDSTLISFLQQNNKSRNQDKKLNDKSDLTYIQTSEIFQNLEQDQVQLKKNYSYIDNKENDPEYADKLLRKEKNLIPKPNFQRKQAKKSLVDSLYRIIEDNTHARSISQQYR